MPTVASISIYITDMEAAIGFYTDVLGFKVKSRPVPFITELDHDGVAVVLCQAEKGVKVDYPTSTGTIIGLVSKDVAAAAKAFAKKKVALVVADPQEFPGGKFIAVRDPSGNVVELLQFGV
jgi:lactoylglutathione lyase